VAPVRTDILEERITSIIMVERISELGIMLAVTSSQGTTNIPTLMMEVILSSKTLVLARAAQFRIPEDDILHSSLYFITVFG
jgi:hypothetical protein